MKTELVASAALFLFFHMSSRQQKHKNNNKKRKPSHFPHTLVHSRTQRFQEHKLSEIVFLYTATSATSSSSVIRLFFRVFPFSFRFVSFLFVEQICLVNRMTDGDDDWFCTNTLKWIVYLLVLSLLLMFYASLCLLLLVLSKYVYYVS